MQDLTVKKWSVVSVNGPHGGGPLSHHSPFHAPTERCEEWEAKRRCPWVRRPLGLAKPEMGPLGHSFEHTIVLSAGEPEDRGMGSETMQKMLHGSSRDDHGQAFPR
jgi:hypothetical protein